MAKAHPIELRERVVARVEEGHTHRSTALQFRVSIKFANDMVKLKRETGSLAAKPVGGRRGSGKLAPHADWIRRQIATKADITLDELRMELQKQFALDVHSSNIGRLLRRLGLTHKKDALRQRAAPRRCETGSPSVADQAIAFHGQDTGKACLH